MKLSVSLPDDDVQFLDQYASDHHVESRSAVVHKAVALLRAADLGAAYESAWSEWASTDDAAVWDGVTRDGLAP
jgi:Arc/MetJ-type ribon-helix-helix transcriptional regulator